MNLILGLFIAKNSLWKFSFSEIFNHYNQITESEHEKKISKMWTRGVTVHITHGLVCIMVLESPFQYSSVCAP